MKPGPKKRKVNYTAVAFAMPFVGMLIVMLAGRYVPFGHYSMLYSDMYHQYYPFFAAFRRALVNGDGLIYSWNVGMGMDYLGLISYYLASPLNLLSVLVPEKLLLGYFALLMPVKLGLAGMFFAIFLKKTFDRDDISISLFGGFYAMCAWALGYQWNVMWLDTFALLPLVALGTVSLLRDRRFALYTLTLFLSIFINYYIGLFICFFVFLLFFCYELCRWRGVRRFFADLVRIAFFSALAIGMTAVLELPALAALQRTQSSVNNFPKGFKLNIASENTWRGLFDAMRKVAGNMGGGVEPTFKEGLPNIYCGVGSVVLAFMFLTARDVRFRDKLCCVGLLVFFIVSFIIRQLDYIWHGFHFTNMMPYRFSFLYSFVLLYMAYRAFVERERFRPVQAAVSGVLTALILALGENREDPVFIACNTLFLLIYTGALLAGTVRNRPRAGCAEDGVSEGGGPPDDALDAGDPPDSPTEDTGSDAAWSEPEDSLTDDDIGESAADDLLGGSIAEGIDEPFDESIDEYIDEPLDDGTDSAAVEAAGSRRKKAAFAVLAAAMGLELVVNLVNFGVRFPCTDISNYPKGTADTAEVVRYMQERESGELFYRAEVSHTQTLNDGALIGYNGISTFTSSANVSVTEFMRRLGYGAKNTYNRYLFEDSSPISNLFLDLKYMIDREGGERENNCFTEIYSSGKVRLLSNNAYLPLGFLANSELGGVEFFPNDPPAGKSQSVDPISEPFRFQNELLAAASGVEGEFWHSVSTSKLEITASDGTDLNPKPASRYCTYTCGEDGGNVSFIYTADSEGLFCVHLDLSGRNSFSIAKNGETLVSDSYTLPQMLSACEARPGDVFKISLVCGSNEKGSMVVRAAILDEDLFYRAYEVLAASRLELTDFSSTRVAGRIVCDRDGLLYTSVPYDGNWYASVDGNPVEPVLTGGCMISLPLTRGEHEIVLSCRNAALSLGWKISLGCAAVFLACLCLRRLRMAQTARKDAALDDESDNARLS